MHWYPECHEPCFCDCDDTDFGDAPCLNHLCEDIDEDDTEDDNLFDVEEDL